MGGGMFEDENEFLPPKEEEIPAGLAKKWEEQEKREGVIKCRSCGKQILAASSFCAYCGDPLNMPNRLWRIGIAVVLLTVLIFFGARIFVH